MLLLLSQLPLLALMLMLLRGALGVLRYTLLALGRTRSTLAGSRMLGSTPPQSDSVGPSPSPPPHPMLHHLLLPPPLLQQLRPQPSTRASSSFFSIFFFASD
jgi:hypothetical protein